MGRDQKGDSCCPGEDQNRNHPINDEVVPGDDDIKGGQTWVLSYTQGKVAMRFMPDGAGSRLH